MPTSLRGIAEKAARDKTHRFGNLFGLLNPSFLLESWRDLNQRAAPGVDQVDAQAYGQDLEGHVKDLVERLKTGSYHAQLVRRHYIPKGQGVTRPLGIPSVEDKLLQTAVKRILEAIYEPDFRACSFGYRPQIGAQDAVKDLTEALQFGRYSYIVEADIQGYFEHIDHGQLVAMLSERIADKPFLRLIRKWLKAGVLETDGAVLYPISGTPQGGVVSPVLANVYLHHVLDVWFEEVVKEHGDGAAYLCRYADDFVCAFQYKRDAMRFYRALGKRLGKYGLKLAMDKTRVMSFSRFRQYEKTRFDFLGFEFRWGTNRLGTDQLKRRTSRKRLQRSIANVTAWIKQNRHRRLPGLFKALNAKLRGYYNYYGVVGNYESLDAFHFQVKRLLYKWLNRRSQRKSYAWPRFGQVLDHFRLEPPRITESAYAA
ncbi:MAG: group II intron reverse transcriptase/maturase [Candidatus Latescibacteria bacterium]|nr:group II intron reverse transcriptase/maturase [Candidatus Latescibacterota bacterium]